MRLLLKDLLTGQDYKIQVRSNDGEHVSQWSQLFDLQTIVDDVAPAVPTSFEVTQEGTTSIATWADVTTNSDGSALNDFSHYEVEAYSDGVAKVYQTRINRYELTFEFNVTAFGQYKNNVGFRVRAVDLTGNVSAWTTRTFGTDTAPSKPAAPMLLKDSSDPTRIKLFVRHDLQKNDGTGRLESDVNRIKIYSRDTASTSPTTAGATLIGTMMVTSTSVFGVSGVMTYADWSSKHFFVTAVDIAGNESTPGPTAPVSGATAGLFADVAVISVAYIDYLEANRVVAGSGFIDNIQVKSSLIMGASRDPSAPADSDGNAVAINQAVMRSANYKYGTDGWIIRGDGYAEFRNLAVNSLNIGRFDQVTQSMMSTKFADFMEDAELWGRHTTSGVEEQDGGTIYDNGTFSGLTNADGAYSARAMLQLVGRTSVRRKSNGLNRGIAYEPGQVYKIWARVRQLTGPLANAINNPTFRGDTTNANTGDVAGDGIPNFWRTYASITPTNTLITGVISPSGTTITTAVRSSGTIPAGGYVGFRANTPLVNSGNTNQNALPVVQGQFYNLSAYFRPNTNPGSPTAHIAIEWYDASGNFLSLSLESSQVVSSSVWTRLSVGGQPPVGAAIAAPRIWVSSPNAGSMNADFTGVQFTQTASVQPYFDGRTTYHSWSGDADASPSYETHTTKYRVGVLGFDDAGNLCAADGSTSSDPTMHYMVAADGTAELATFDGTNSESAGWVEVTGYLRDRTDSVTPPGARPDAYNPAGVHKNVRFIVPFVQMNINDNPVDTNYLAQLDMFSIESSNTLAPTVFRTGVSKGITIEDIVGDDWSHAIRLYSGNEDEKYPAMITEIQDQDFNQTHSMIVSPTQTLPGDRTSLNDGVRIRGRNANLISNSSFENPYFVVSTNADFELNRFAIGVINASRALDTVNYHQGWGEQSIKLTSSSSGNTYLYHHLLSYKFPEILGQNKLTVSAWVRNAPANPGALDAGFFINVYDDSGTRIGEMPTFGTMQTQSIPKDGEWYRVSYTFDFTSTFPDGFPDSTTIWDIGFGFVATASGQVFNFDDIQVEIGGTLTDYKPQTPNSYYMPGAGMILGNKLVISDRVKSFDEITNIRWNPQLDYESAHPAVHLEKDGMLATLEKWSGINTTGGGYNESYLALRVLDDQGVIQSPWMQLKDSNDEQYPNTIQFFNQNRALMGQFGSMADPTNPEANAAGKDLVIQGAFRAAGYPNWTVANLGTGFTHTGGAYPFSSFNSNGITYLRGSIVASGTTTAGGAVAQLSADHWPQVTGYISASYTPGGGSNVAGPNIIFTVDNTGVLRARNPYFGLSIPTGTIIFFDGCFFSTAATNTVAGSGGQNPTTIGPATQPTSLTLTPYASSTTTGTYRVSWVNANDPDNAKVRLVWRVDRTPAGANDGNIVNITTVNNSAQSYLLSGLPVGRRIYVRLFAINKAGVFASATGAPAASRFLLASPTVVYANSSASYRDGYGGMWRNDGDQVYQGEWTGNDNHRGLFFYGTQISDRLNLGGVSRTPTKMTIYLQRTGSGGIYGAVPIDLYPTALATKPTGAPAMVLSQTAGQNIVSLKTNQGATVTLPSLWYPVYASGTYKGFAIYNSGSDYAVLYGRSANSAHGKITIYHKG